MVKIIRKGDFKFLAKSWRPNCCVSRIKENKGTINGTFSVFLPIRPVTEKFIRTIGKGVSMYNLNMQLESVEFFDETIPTLYKAVIVYYTGEAERREFLRRLGEQRYFLELDKLKHVIKRYDTTCEVCKDWF